MFNHFHRWTLSLLAAAVFTLIGSLSAFGAGYSAEEPLPYTVWRNTAGPIQLVLNQQPFRTELDKPYQLDWKLVNSSDQPIECQMTFYSVDTVTPLKDGKNAAKVESKVSVPAKGEAVGMFSYMLLKGTLNAHYPLHVRAAFKTDKNYEAYAVRVIEAKLAAPPKEFKTTEISIGGISLLSQSYIASYLFDGKEEVELGPFWTGSDKTCRGNISPGLLTLEGETRMGFALHPPYIPKGGRMFMKFPIALGQEKGYTLAYGCCLRRNPPTEPPSDGVTFKIYARLVGDDEKILLDDYTVTSFSWVDRTVSLDRYAGQKLDLIVEVNPGPKNITTCDSCGLSGMSIFSQRGNKAPEMTTSRKYLFDLKGNMKAEIKPGPRGILDANIKIGNSKAQVTYNGIQLAIGNLFLNDANTQFTSTPKMEMDSETKKLTCRYNVLMNDEIIPVTVLVGVENGMLVFELPKENPARIGRLQMKSLDREPKRSYYGHGYIVEKPRKNIIIGGGGHALSTSHVGFDFDNGLSILMASTVPPTFLQLSPEKKIYSLDVSGYTKFALLPGDKGALAAAIDYRDHSGWKKAPSKGVARKAGRLVFDVWGGQADQLIKTMNTVFKYGVTDSLFFQHAWQRWGYDVRLPDIWAPDTDRVMGGSIEGYQQLAQLCAAKNVPFGLHDNYIDYYPDAEEYSYKYIVFTEQGTPHKAWINEGIGARSYRWRPDLFKPFLERNMKIANRYLPTMDAYFVDVFTSMNVFDYYTQDGKFVSKTVTQAKWKEAFEVIGQYLAHKDANGAVQTGITSSEAGDDFLIGSLDAADAQWVELVTEGRRYAAYVPCENWARTPWFTAVNHTNFSRYGAGYSGRYEALRTRDVHGIMSDDYISSEMLGGLDLMVDYGSLFPGSIIKHYLAQHVVRRLADKEILSVEFAQEENGDNIFRQTVNWSDGTKVCVNKSETDWSVSGYTLPMYGYAVFDKDGKYLSGIVRNPADKGEVVEISCRPDSFYLNGRGYRKSSQLAIEPKLGQFKDHGNGRFEVIVDWHSKLPAPKDLAVFLHIFAESDEFESGWYAGGEWPAVPTSTWGTSEKTALIQSGRNQILTVPKNLADGTYTILVGLYDSRGNGQRYSLIGKRADSSRYGIANLVIKRENGKINLSTEPFEGEKSLDHPTAVARLILNKTPVTYQGVSTRGAVSVTPGKESWKILPIPVEKEFAVELNEKEIKREVVRVAVEGKEVPFKRGNGTVLFNVLAEEARVYEIFFK